MKCSLVEDISRYISTYKIVENELEMCPVAKDWDSNGIDTVSFKFRLKIWLNHNDQIMDRQIKIGNLPLDFYANGVVRETDVENANIKETKTPWVCF